MENTRVDENTSVENKDTAATVAQVEKAVVTAENTVAPSPQENLPNAPVKATPNEKANFPKMRERMQQLELEKKAYADKLAEIDKKRYDELDEIDQLKEDVQSIKNESARKAKIRQENQAAEQSKELEEQIEKNLRIEFPDIDEVLSDKNIAALRASDPTFASLLAQKTNNYSELYNRGIAAYSLIKKRGLHTQDNIANQTADKAKLIDDNLSKPVPASSVATAAPSKPLADFANFTGKGAAERKAYINRLSRERADR